MPHAVTIDSASYYLCYNLEAGVFHFGFAQEASRITTGQPNCELFVNELAMAARIDELKGINGWYDANKLQPADGETPPSNVT